VEDPSPCGRLHPDDKKQFATAITSIYEAVPIPRFYVVVLFEEVSAENCLRRGDLARQFVRINIDQMARTLARTGCCASGGSTTWTR
jgi:hypothetical protein